MRGKFWRYEKCGTDVWEVREACSIRDLKENADYVEE